jgi:outer membrane protein
MTKKLLQITILAALAALVAAPALAEAGDHQFRTRLIFISPNDDLSVSQDFKDFFGGSPDGTLSVESDFTLEFDYSYFFTDNWAMEIIAAFPTQGIEVDVPDNDTGIDNVGGVRHAPLTFLAQYHFMPDAKTQPYVGLGFNYTIFLEEYGVLLNDVVDIDSSSFGFAVQAGIDFQITDNLYFNVDLKYVEIETDLEIKEDFLDSGFPETLNAGTLEINPLIFGFGVGYRF